MIYHSLQIFSDTVLFSSQYWVVETESFDQLSSGLSNVDIPIDSNVLMFMGNKSEHLELYDVYRPQPFSDIR